MVVIDDQPDFENEEHDGYADELREDIVLENEPEMKSGFKDLERISREAITETKEHKNVMIRIKQIYKRLNINDEDIEDVAINSEEIIKMWNDKKLIKESLYNTLEGDLIIICMTMYDLLKYGVKITLREIIEKLYSNTKSKKGKEIKIPRIIDISDYNLDDYLFVNLGRNKMTKSNMIKYIEKDNNLFAILELADTIDRTLRQQLNLKFVTQENLIPLDLIPIERKNKVIEDEYFIDSEGKKMVKSHYEPESSFQTARDYIDKNSNNRNMIISKRTRDTYNKKFTTISEILKKENPKEKVRIIWNPYERQILNNLLEKVKVKYMKTNDNKYKEIIDNLHLGPYYKSKNNYYKTVYDALINTIKKFRENQENRKIKIQKINKKKSDFVMNKRNELINSKRKFEDNLDKEEFKIKNKPNKFTKQNELDGIRRRTNKYTKTKKFDPETQENKVKRQMQDEYNEELEFMRTHINKGVKGKALTHKLKKRKTENTESDSESDSKSDSESESESESD